MNLDSRFFYHYQPNVNCVFLAFVWKKVSWDLNSLIHPHTKSHIKKSRNGTQLTLFDSVFEELMGCSTVQDHKTNPGRVKIRTYNFDLCGGDKT